MKPHLISAEFQARVENVPSERSLRVFRLEVFFGDSLKSGRDASAVPAVESVESVKTRFDSAEARCQIVPQIMDFILQLDDLVVDSVEALLRRGVSGCL